MGLNVILKTDVTGIPDRLFMQRELFIPNLSIRFRYLFVIYKTSTMNLDKNIY